MRTTKEQLKLVTDKVYCDGCNACCSSSNFGHDYAELDAWWGYNSTLDGTKYDIQFCENCFKDVIQLLQTKRKLWSKTDINNPLYGELKYNG
jgi:hypothetical protein